MRRRSSRTEGEMKEGRREEEKEIVRVKSKENMREHAGR